MSRKTPRIARWEDQGGRNRATLVRSDADPKRDMLRQVTVIFSPEEWALIEDTVLDQYGLMSKRAAATERDAAYEEVERLHQMLTETERELAYVAEVDDA